MILHSTTEEELSSELLLVSAEPKSNSRAKTQLHLRTRLLKSPDQHLLAAQVQSADGGRELDRVYLVHLDGDSASRPKRPRPPHQILRVGNTSEGTPSSNIDAFFNQPLLKSSPEYAEIPLSFSLDSGLLAYYSHKSRTVEISDCRSGDIAYSIHLDLSVISQQSQSDNHQPLGAVSSLVFFDPHVHGRHVLTSAPSMTSKSIYDYELMVVDNRGRARTYLLKALSNLDSGSVQTHIGSAETHPGNCITFHHAFHFQNHASVHCAIYDAALKRLVVGGLGASAMLRGSGKVQCSGVSFWTILPKQPYFAPWTLRHDDSKDLDFLAASSSKSVWNRIIEAIPFQKLGLGYSGKETTEISKNAVTKLDVSPDGRRLISLDLKGDCTVWDLDEQLRSECLHMYDFDSRIQRTLHLRDFVSDLSDDNEQIMDISWWSDFDLIVRFVSGKFGIYNISDAEPQSLLDELESHHPICQMTSRLGEGADVFLFDCAVTEGIAKIRKSDRKIVSIKTEDTAGSQNLGSTDDGQAASSWRSQLWIWILSIWTAYFVVPITFLTSTLLWHWESASNDPSALSEYFIYSWHFHLLRVHESTPTSLLDSKISAHEYSEALQVAQKFNLDTDRVHKAQWMQSTAVTADLIKECLDRVHDSEWKIRQCQERICSDAQTQEVLYRYGLELCNFLDELEGDPKAGDDTWEERLKNVKLDLAQVEKARARFKILKYLDRLQTYVQLRDLESTTANQSIGLLLKSFRSFRDVDMKQQAIQCAQLEHFNELMILMERHHEETLGARLEILSSVPETADPEEYESLLPKINVLTNKVEEWDTKKTSRRLDWVESQTIAAQLGPGFQDRQHSYPNADFVSEWYVKRVRKVDMESHQLDNATALARLALKNGATGCGIEDVFRTLEMLDAYVYDPILDELRIELIELPESSVKLSLASFESMADEDLLQLLLSRGKSVYASRELIELFQHDLSIHVIPFLKSRGKLDLLWKYFVNISKADLTLFWITYCSEDSKLSSEFEQAGVEYHFCAIECCMTCTNTSQKNYVEDIMLRIQLNAPKNVLSSDSLKTLESSLYITNILSVYGMLFSPNQLVKLKGDQHAQTNFLTRLARIPIQALSSTTNTGGGRSFDSANDLEEFLGAMKKVQDRVCPLVNPRQVEETLLLALLTCGTDHFFKPIQELLFSPTSSRIAIVPKDTAVEILIKAARDFFDNAQSGDMTDGYLKFSYDVLRIVPSKMLNDADFLEISLELDLVQAVHDVCIKYGALGETGAPLLPIEIRLKRNRLDILNDVLRSSNKAYKDKVSMFELARQLTQRDDTLLKMRVLEMAIAEAVGRKDFLCAYAYCLDLARFVSSDDGDGEDYQYARTIASKACYQVAMQKEFRDMAKRQHLIGEVLNILPPESDSGSPSFDELFDVWYSLDEREHQNRLWLAPEKFKKTAHIDMSEDGSMTVEVEEDMAGVVLTNALDGVMSSDFLTSMRNINSYIEGDFEGRFPSSDLRANPSLDWAQSLLHLTLSRPTGEPCLPAIESLLAIHMLSPAFGEACVLLQSLPKQSVERLIFQLSEKQQTKFKDGLVVWISIHCLRDAISLDTLLSVPPVQIVELVEALIELDATKYPAALVDLFRKSRLWQQQDFQERNLQEIYSDPDIDVERFKSDANYRKSVVHRMAESTDLARLQRALILAESNGVSKSDLIQMHVEFLFDSPSRYELIQAHIDALQDLFSAPEMKSRMLNYMTMLLSRELDNTEFAVTRLVCDCIKRWGDETPIVQHIQIRSRLIDPLNTLNDEAAFRLTFRDLFCMKRQVEQLKLGEYFKAESFEAIFSAIGVFDSINALEAFCQLLEAGLADLHLIETNENENELKIRLSEISNSQWPNYEPDDIRLMFVLREIDVDVERGVSYTGMIGSFSEARQRAVFEKVICLITSDTRTTSSKFLQQILELLTNSRVTSSKWTNLLQFHLFLSENYSFAVKSEVLQNLNGVDIKSNMVKLIFEHVEDTDLISKSYEFLSIQREDVPSLFELYVYCINESISSESKKTFKKLLSVVSSHNNESEFASLPSKVKELLQNADGTMRLYGLELLNELWGDSEASKAELAKMKFSLSLSVFADPPGADNEISAIKSLLDRKLSKADLYRVASLIQTLHTSELAQVDELWRMFWEKCLDSELQLMLGPFVLTRLANPSIEFESQSPSFLGKLTSGGTSVAPTDLVALDENNMLDQPIIAALSLQKVSFVELIKTNGPKDFLSRVITNAQKIPVHGQFESVLKKIFDEVVPVDQFLAGSLLLQVTGTHSMFNRFALIEPLLARWKAVITASTKAHAAEKPSVDMMSIPDSVWRDEAATLEHFNQVLMLYLSRNQ